MIALGICDDRDGAAALVVDDGLRGVLSQVEVDRQPDNVVFPSGAVDALLANAGIHAQEVDRVLFGGTMTPNTLRRLQSSRLSRVAPQTSALARAVLRRTGLHMLDADLARSVLRARLAEHGLTGAQVELQEIHTALAAAAYQTQGDPDALVLVAQPRGDGLGLSAWVGDAGQLDAVMNQSELALLLRAIDLVMAEARLERWHPDALRSGLAPDPEIVALLDGRIGFRNGRFPHAGRAEHAGDSFWRDLRARAPWANIAHALADVAANSLVAWAAEWIQHTGRHTVALAGELFDDGVVLARIAELTGIETVWLAPGGWARARAIGAVLDGVGLAPRALESAYLGIDFSDEACMRALAARRLVASRTKNVPRVVAQVLRDGGRVGVFRGRGEASDLPLGNRVIATRPDHPRAGSVLLGGAVPRALESTARFAAWMDPNGRRPLRTDHPWWKAVAAEVRFAPLLDRGGVTVFSPEEAVEAYEAESLDAMVLNDRVVTR
jgi:predicted NodU family carbamoyl transferase